MDRKQIQTLMSSERMDWETPPELFDPLNEEFHFTLDVCATAQNAKCTRFFTPEEDGLKQKWTGVCWMNPPYGREVKAWMKKAYMFGAASGLSARRAPLPFLPRLLFSVEQGKPEGAAAFCGGSLRLFAALPASRALGGVVTGKTRRYTGYIVVCHMYKPSLPHGGPGTGSGHTLDKRKDLCMA